MIRNKDKVQQAQKFNLPVVNESFITAVNNGDMNDIVRKYNIASWTEGKVSKLITCSVVHDINIFLSLGNNT